MPPIGTYLKPSKLDHLPEVAEALNLFLGIYPSVLGYLNMEIGRLSNPRDQQVTNFLASFELVDLLSHF